MRLVVIHLGQRIKTVLSEHDFVPPLLEKNFGTAPDGVAVVNHQNFESRSRRIHKTLLLN